MVDLTSNLPPLQHHYKNALVRFYELGGSGVLNVHHRVLAGPTREMLPGDLSCWIVLVSHGLIAGEGGMLIMTELGRELAETVVQGRVRVAS